MFVEADPIWTGEFLEVNRRFVGRKDSSHILETLILYLLCWTDWSETRWCAVKGASRKMIRAGICGVQKLVELVKDDRDLSSYHINGFARLVAEGRFYLCLAACSSAPAEAVHIMLLKDDRFLRFGVEMRREMVHHLDRIASYPQLIWKRLHDYVGEGFGRSWHHLRSEAIRSAVVGTGYLEFAAFGCLGQPPWLYTQGDIANHIEQIGGRELHELPQDETTMKIAIGLANGVQPQIFVEGLKLLRDASMTTNVNERAHGYGARLVEDHARYGYDLVACRSTLNSAYPLFHATGVQKQVQMLQTEIARLDHRKPERTPATAMHFKQIAGDRIAQGFGDDDDTFHEMRLTMDKQTQRWGELSGQRKQPFYEARVQHIGEQQQIIAEARADLQEQVRRLQEAALAELRLHGLPNSMSASMKFSEEDLDELAAMLSPDGACADPPQQAEATAPEEPTSLEMNELEELHASLFPQAIEDVTRPWWIREVARNRDEWHAAAIFDVEGDDETIYLFLFASQSPQLAWFLECREVARVVHDPDERRGDEDDITDNYRQFEFLHPLVLLADHQLPFDEDTEIGVYQDTVFRGPRLCVFHAPLSFDDFVQPHFDDSAESKPSHAPRKHASRDDIDQLLAMHPWLTREDFGDEPVRRPLGRRRGAALPRIADEGSDGSDDASDHVSDGLADDDHPEGDAPAHDVDVAEELAAVRDDVARALDDHPDLYFRVVTRGGEWTYEHTGHVADSNRGEARGELAKSWCRRFGWPLTMTFSMHRYGREGSARLAQEFCRRSAFLFGLFQESGVCEDSFAYSQHDIASCPEDMEFLDFVLQFDADDAILLRAHDLRALAPRIG